MYGTIFRMKVKTGKDQELRDVFNEWERERRPRIQGNVHSLLLKPDNKPGEVIGIAIFSDKPSYEANAEDPEQDKWYRKMRALLEDEPEWEDGEFILGDI